MKLASPHFRCTSDSVACSLGVERTALGRLEVPLELLDPHDVGVGDALLLLELPLVHLDLLVEFVQRLLQDDDVLPVLLGLQQQLLDGPASSVCISHFRTGTSTTRYRRGVGVMTPALDMDPESDFQVFGDNAKDTR